MIMLMLYQLKLLESKVYGNFSSLVLFTKIPLVLTIQSWESKVYGVYPVYVPQPVNRIKTAMGNTIQKTIASSPVLYKDISNPISFLTLYSILK